MTIEMAAGDYAPDYAEYWYDEEAIDAARALEAQRKQDRYIRQASDELEW